jgi:cysteine-rich repeat protein
VAGNDAGSDAGGSAGAGGAGCSADAAPDDPAYGCGAPDCKPCDATHGTPGCSAGHCTISCDNGYGDCDSDAKNGCEADFSSSATCGSCGNACTAGQSCAAGKCKVVCGDGVIGGTEDCDDGNTKNLDGCASSCRYEVFTRMTSLSIETATGPAFCAPGTNTFGNVFPGGVVDILNNELSDSLTNGTLNLVLGFSGLDDLTGQNDASLSLGVLSGKLDPKHTGAWSAGAIDFWFLADPGTIDAQGQPTELLPGASITSGALVVDPSKISMPFAGSTLDLLAAHLRATVDSSPAPDVPAPPPSQLATGLAVFRTLTATGAGQGLCGNATVESLAKIPLPQSFATGGLSACIDSSSFGSCSSTPSITSHAYTWCGEHCGNPGDPDYDANGCSSCTADHCHSNPVGSGCNSLLDAIIGGCVVNPPDCKEAFIPTQPDVGTGGNAPAKLTLGSGNKVTPSVATDAYSAYFRFAANRAHVTNNLP